MKKLILISLLISSTQLHSGSFIFAGESFGVDLVLHPQGFTASPPSVIQVEVCIDPSGTETTALESPVKNIITTFNRFRYVDSNLVGGSSNNIPSGALDWESVALHEVGHCLGLAHPNLGSRTGVSGSNTDYTNTTDGVDNTFAFGSGGDGIIGSSDDQRSDDINLHWFNKDINNPFVATLPFDGTNYSRDVMDLPNGHDFVANADRTVGASLGFSNSETVMQQGTYSDEDQRELGVDDVATLSLGMSGVDMVAGNSDDYSIELTYGGISSASSCDINIKHHAMSGLAFCSTGGQGVTGNHWRITTANIEMSNGFTWFYNDVIFEDGYE